MERQAGARGRGLWGPNMESGLYPTSIGMQVVQPLWKIASQLLMKINIHLPYNPEAPHPSEMKTYFHTEESMWVFVTVLFVITQKNYSIFCMLWWLYHSVFVKFSIIIYSMEWFYCMEISHWLKELWGNISGFLVEEEHCQICVFNRLLWLGDDKNGNGTPLRGR